MQFGTKKADATTQVVDGGEVLKYLRNFREGDNEVRFIDEVDDWISFSEHYSTDNKSFPCTMNRDSCPGCTSEIEKVQRASRKYATNVKLVSNGMVLPFRIPMSLAKKLFNRAERNGTITNRDYIVMREGKGLDTEYDLEQGDRGEVDLSALREQSMDIEEVLVTAYEEVWGPINQEEKEEEIPFDASDDVEIDEATIRQMKRDQLIALATENEIDIDTDGSRKEILETILEAAV